jgi:hypothetical protein
MQQVASPGAVALQHALDAEALRSYDKRVIDDIAPHICHSFGSRSSSNGDLGSSSDSVS